VNDRRSSSDLGSSAEATLGAFPFPERDWEKDARAIEARLTDSVRGSTDPSLLLAPLPSESGEPSSPSATATPLTNSGVRTQSLTEVARRSVEKKQASERQMARESLALAAQQRQLPLHAKAPHLSAGVGVAANSVAANSVAVNGVAPNSVAVSGVSASNVAASNASRRTAAQASSGAEKSKPFPKVALALPALALAAAALLWFRHSEPAPLVGSASTPAATTAAATAVAPSERAENEGLHHAQTATDGSPRGVDPSTLPDEATPTADSAGSRVATASGSAQAATAGAKVASNKPGQKGDRVAVDAKTVDPGLPPDPGLRPADSRGGEIPAKPSTGAVQAALGSVMGGARHCVAGDEAPSSAVVVFGSDGRVQHVTVSGSAAGKSSAACIEAQLSRARVQPFAASSFSVNATVRPE